MPNSRWGDTGSDCAVGRQYLQIAIFCSVADCPLTLVVLGCIPDVLQPSAGNPDVRK
jgi:hypothetical protein